MYTMFPHESRLFADLYVAMHNALVIVSENLSLLVGGLCVGLGFCASRS